MGANDPNQADGEAPVRLRVDYDDADDLIREHDGVLASGRGFFGTSRAFAVGARVQLALGFRGLREPIVVAGVVVEVRPDDTPGVVVELDPGARIALAVTIERLRAGAPDLVRRTVRILLVEDNPYLASLLRTGLRAPAGSNVELELHEAADGREALAHLAANRYDVVIVDVYLPVVDGSEVIRRGRDELGHAEVPFIAVSAGGSPARNAALAAGAQLFLDKPIRLRQVIETIRKLCNL